MGLAFGGINIVTQVSACLIMLAATLKMKSLTKKNGFDTSQFQDIKMNLIVSLLICIGYAIDYIADIIISVLYIEGKINLDQEALYVTISELFLNLCIFAAYMILMKIFMTYQKQVNEAAARLVQEKEKAHAKEQKLGALKKKMEQSQLNGETGVTPSHQDLDEPLINPVDGDSRGTPGLGAKVALNADMGDENDADNDLSDEENADNFVMAAMLKKKKSLATGRRDSALTVEEDEADADRESSDEDSIKTDSSGDSVLDESYDDLDETDIALQNQIMTNFVAMYRKSNNMGGSRSFLIRQETKFTTFSPTNAGAADGGDRENKLKK